jgi:hypothetical protein
VKDPIEVNDPEAQFASPDVKGMAAAITVTAQISQTRSIVMQTYLDRDAPVTQFHAVLDKFDKAIGRQEAKTNLEENKANLKLEEKTLEQLVEDYNNIEKRAADTWKQRGKQGEPKLTQGEAAQKENAQVTIGRYRDAITKRKGDIARLEAIVAEGD